MRSAICLLLVAALGAAGCDRQSDQPEQAQESPASTANAVDGAADLAGTLDRSHAGEAAPDTLFENPQGKQVSIADFAGKPVLVNLWATWCAPCIAEMPTLDTLAADIGDDVQVVTVSEDLGGKEKVDPFFAKAKFEQLQPYLDPKLALTTAYNANLPTTVLYDSHGREIWRVTGGLDWTSDRARTLIAESSE